MSSTPNFEKSSRTAMYQGIKQSLCTSTVANAEMATLSNISLSRFKEVTIDSSTQLMPSTMAFHDLIQLFYANPGAPFSMSASNCDFKPIHLHGQFYLAGDNKKNGWNLYNQLISTYCEKHSIPENNISAFKKIELIKETSRYLSLATAHGSQVALSWDMVIDHLKTTHQIKYTKDPEDSASVNLLLNYIFHSDVLDVTLEVVFTFHTAIPFYKNVLYSENHSMIPAYSNDEEPKLRAAIPGVLPQKSVNFEASNKEKKEETPIKQDSNEVVDADYDAESVLTKRILDSLYKTNAVDAEEENDDNESIAASFAQSKTW